MNGLEAIAQALRGKLIDAIALPVDEYWELRKEVDPAFSSGVATKDGSRRSMSSWCIGTARSIASRIFGERSVVFWKNPRTSLASAWLDVLLLSAAARASPSSAG